MGKGSASGGRGGGERDVSALRAAHEAHRERQGDTAAGGGIGSPLRDPRELDELATHPGLCATCVHLRLLRSPRSTFTRCALAEQDERFPRYPRLPVVACAGHRVASAPEVGAALAPARSAPDDEARKLASLPHPADDVLHITNGDSVLRGFVDGGITNEAVAWRDVLHDGPLPETATLAELSEIRARALATFGWGSYPELRRDFARRDAALAHAGAYRELVLWFEHDLYDQLQLLQILAWFARHGSGGARLSLVQIDRFPGVEPFFGLGQLDGAQLASLLPRRQPVTARQLALAGEAWAEVRAPEPLRLAARARVAMPELPFLAAALRRLCAEYPWTTDGLARSERQVLAAVAAGAHDGRAVYVQASAAEDVPWGDASVALRVATLLAAPQPALVRGARGLELTTTGERVLRGDDDWVRASGGIDRWVGGVHLRGSAVRWRWDPRAATLVASDGGP